MSADSLLASSLCESPVGVSVGRLEKADLWINDKKLGNCTHHGCENDNAYLQIN